MEDINESLAAHAMSEGSDIPTALAQLVGKCSLKNIQYCLNAVLLRRDCSSTGDAILNESNITAVFP